MTEGHLLRAQSQWLALNSGVSPMNGNDQSPSGSGRSSRGTCVPLLCQSRLGAELDVAALALVLLGCDCAKVTKAAL